MANKIIIADIFGHTPALMALAKTINADTIIDPYGGQYMGFDSEAHAYHYFNENVGLDAYVQKLSKVMRECVNNTVLIGFSVGAAAIWQFSGSVPENLTRRVTGAICFYGSQIRYLTDLSPQFKIKLIFPKTESHFDVLVLKQLLEQTPKVSTAHVDYLHGFMNSHSNNFNQIGYDEHSLLLQQA